MNYIFTQAIFYFGFTFFILHEMDAIKRKEWRMFNIFSKQDDQLAYTVFSVLHLPLFFIILMCMKMYRNNTMIILDIFFIIHLILHMMFIKHKQNEFHSYYSWFLIIGMSLLGVLNLLML